MPTRGSVKREDGPESQPEAQGGEPILHGPVARTPSGRGRGRNVVMVAVVATVLVLAALGGTWIYVTSRGGVPALPSLQVRIATSGAVSGGAALAGPAQVYVFSPNPILVGKGAYLPGGPGAASPSVLLFYGSEDTTSATVSGQLPPAFAEVAKEWTNVVPRGSEVSLLLEGVYSEIIGDQSLEYVSFNWVDYNPYSPPGQFSSTMTFNLSDPSAVVGLSGPAPSCIPNGHGGCIPPGGCPNPYNGVNLVNSTSVSGPFPLSATVNQGYTSNTDESVLSQTNIDQTVNLDFTGGGWTENQSFTTDGTTPTFSSPSETLSVTQLGAEADSSGQMGIISLENATLYIQITHPYEVYYTGSSPDCVAHYNYYPLEVTAYVDDLTSNFGLISATATSSFANAFLNFMKVTDAGSPYSIGKGSYIDFVNGVDQAPGYSNANSIFTQAANASSTFDVGLGAALAMIDLEDVCPFDNCSAAQVVQAVGAFDAALGVATQVASDLNTFSFSTEPGQSLQISSLTNVAFGPSPGTQSAQFFQGSDPTQIPDAPGSPSANMPAPYVIVT
jgi:hypothetical protein